MARKWLSGALAFAMIFGCSAPVALADETPVEVVEVAQESLEDVEQYAINAPEFVKSSYEMAGKKGTKLDIAMSGINEEADSYSFDVKGSGEYKNIVGGSEDSERFSGSWDEDKKVLTIELKSDMDTETTYTIRGTINFGANEKYVVTTQVKVSAVEDAVTYTEKVTGIEEKGNTVNQGASFDVTFVNDASGDENDKKPYSVNYTLGSGASNYIDVSVKEEDKKTTATITGKAVTPENEDVGVLFTVVWNEGDDAKTYEARVKVTGDEHEVSNLSISKGKSTIGGGESTNVIAQAKYVDEYGREMDNDDAIIYWSINGEEVTGTGTIKADDEKETDLLGYKVKDAVLELTGYNAGAGVYTIEAKSANGKTVSTTITVESNATISKIAVKDDGAHIGKITPEGTVDLSKLDYVLTDSEDNELTLAASGAKLTYKVTEIKKTKGAYDQGANINTKVDDVAAVDANGVVTLKDGVEDALKELDDNYTTLRIKANVKVDGTSASCDVWFLVAEPSDVAAGVEILNADGTEIKNGYALVAVGTPVKFTAKVTDSLGYTEGLDQDVVWQIENKDTSDATVYATVSQDGVVTPLVSGINKVELAAYSKANLRVKASITLNIENAPAPTATPEPSVEPSAEPSVEPTVEPTEAPTEKPAERTGVVVNVSSNLNIREAANIRSNVVTKVKNGTELTILGEENGFYKVRLADGKEGYASKQYVRETTPSEPDQEPTGDYVIVDVSSTLRLRQQPNTHSATLAYMPDGATLELLSYGDEWCYVEYNGVKGYAFTAHLIRVPGAVG